MPAPTSGGAWNRAPLGVLVALALAVMGGILYAAYVRAGYDAVRDEYATVGWAGVLLGVIAGGVLGVLARTRLVPQLLGAVCTSAGAAFGELYGTLLSLHREPGAAFEEFVTDFGTVWQLWSGMAQPVHYLLWALVPLATVATAQAFGRVLAMER